VLESRLRCLDEFHSLWTNISERISTNFLVPEGSSSFRKEKEESNTPLLAERGKHQLISPLYCFGVWFYQAIRCLPTEEWRSPSSPTGHTFSAALSHWPSSHFSRIRRSLHCRRAPAKYCGCVTTSVDGQSTSMTLLLMRAFVSSATQCRRASRGGQASTWSRIWGPD
jgi:hypothetical protein